MSPTADAKFATLPRASAWVSANAGAGKTQLLTARVTRLLLNGTPPARILCLTYTKAAAAEMSARLFNNLGKWTLLPDDALAAELQTIGATDLQAENLTQARQLFAKALETPGGLKIQTIHSFCQHVLARFPVEAGVPARFTVLDERSAQELMRTARNHVLERAGRGEKDLAQAVGTLAAHAADTRFADLLSEALRDAAPLRDRLARHGGLEKLFAHIRNGLGVKPDATEESILHAFCSALGDEKDHCRRAVSWLLSGSAADRKQGEIFSAFLDDMRGENFLKLRALFFTTAHELRKRPVTRAAMDASPALAAWFDTLAERVIAVENERRAVKTARLTEALVTVTLAVLEKYEALKARRAALDFEDLVARALSLLEKKNAAAWVLYKLDHGLDHILVDEAQDTSPEQWRIVRKLSEEFFAGKGRDTVHTPRTVFAVGDEKQSIFSFQGADPGEFGRNRMFFDRHVRDAGLDFHDVRPLTSRRSAKAILSFVDAVFENTAAREGLTFENSAIAHAPVLAVEGRVELWPAVPAPAVVKRKHWRDPVDSVAPESAAGVLAARIAEQIASWIKDGVMLRGAGRAIQAGDVMILVRRRNAFADAMIRELMRRNVRVAGADRMVLLDQIAIMDLLALGRFALLPEDDLNLAALLKSPLLGLDEEQVFRLAYDRKTSLWRELTARKRETREFEEAHGFLEKILARADFVPPFEFYSDMLSGFGQARIRARLGEEAEDAIDEFLSLSLIYESAHPPSLQGFLDWFARGASEVKRDMEAAGGAVRVMTVHGAKGLEAPVVIVPDTAQVPDHERKSAFLYTEDGLYYGVSSALETEAVARAKENARQAELREYRRLLYVALTRAREVLVLCGYESNNRIHPQSWYALLEDAAKRMGREEADGERKILAMGATLERSEGVSANQKRKEPSLPAFLKAPTTPEDAALRILRPSEAAGLEEPTILSPVSAGGAKRFARGLLIHALLAALPDIAAGDRRQAALNYLSGRNIPEEERDAIVDETLRVLDHPDFAPVFALGSRAEISITAELPEIGPGVKVSGQIDRLAVTDDAVLIADFKTNRPPPSHEKDIPALYRAQMALYRAALKKIYPWKRIACALIWTDGARLMPLSDGLLDMELAKITKRFV